MPQVRTATSLVDTNTSIYQGTAWSDAVPLVRKDTGVWGMVTYTIAVTTTDLNLSNVFGNLWTQNVEKRVIINSGVTVGSASTASYALNIPTGMGGTLYIENNGSIQGAGGSTNSGTGGSAIFAGSIVTIDNNGTIYAGGGGGGVGGKGGDGVYSCPDEYQYCQQNQNRNCNQGSYQYTRNCRCCCGSDSACCARVWRNVCYYNQYSTGAAGGSGGVGRGYNQSATAGSGGSPAPTDPQCCTGSTNGCGSFCLGGGTTAGSGGTGGTGGGWGTSGSDGNRGTNGNLTTAPTLGNTGGPVSGGLAGFYIVNNTNVTWISTGTRLGRVG